MNLFVNMLIDWENDSPDHQTERVLWIDSRGTQAAMINIHNKKALPRLREYQDVVNALSAGQARVLESDPYLRGYRRDDDLPLEYRQKRDKRWAVIESLLVTPDIFIPERRGRLIAAVVGQGGGEEDKQEGKEKGPTKKEVYHLLRRYWQRGQTKNALLPDFDNCGGRGKPRPVKDRNAPKRGRRSLLAKARGMPTGVNVDDVTLERLRVGFKLLEDGKEPDQAAAHQRVLERFYNVGFELKDGDLVPVLPPADETPSVRQFRYWYAKERDPQRAIEAQEGRGAYNSRFRPIVGDVYHMAVGPGSMYMVDATPAKITLVSSLDRSQIIGSPTLYFLVDVFSGLIPGLYIGLEAASWAAAMLAQDNAFSEKVSFCESYHISITEDDWPARCLPEVMLADRGEFEGYNADPLVNALGIRVDNTAPYRGDLKALVERDFRSARDEMIRRLPGQIRRIRERGVRDSRLGAVLTLREFTQLIIYWVLGHNAEHRIKDYPLDEDMIADHVEPYPLELWRWGIENRVGHLRTMAPEIIRLNLLPSETASVTREGIQFRGLDYTCARAQKEQWSVRAVERGSWRIPVAYDPRRADVMFLRSDDGQQLEPCELLSRCQAFRGRSWYEVDAYFAQKKVQEQESTTRKQRMLAERNAHKDRIVADAARETAEAVKAAGESKTARLRNIGKNRQEELARERQASALSSGIVAPPDQIESEVAPTPVDEATIPGYVPPPQNIEKLRQAREKKMRKQKEARNG